MVLVHNESPLPRPTSPIDETFHRLSGHRAASRLRPAEADDAGDAGDNRAIRINPICRKCGNRDQDRDC